MTSHQERNTVSARSGRKYSIDFFENPSVYLPIFVTAILILWAWTFQARMLSLGAIERIDEFRTLDRVTGFSRAGDWFNVYSLNEPNFRKPPLHYWLGAILYEQGVDLTVSVRAPSMIFALGCLVSTAWLAALVSPGNLWAVPTAVLFLTTSRRFWTSSSQALLDTGVLFFATASLAAAMMALRRPRWWYVSAVLIALGSLQKAPVALAVVVLFLLLTGLTARWHSFRFRSFLKNQHFLISAVLALAVSASWYIFQVAQHGLVVLEVGIANEMIDRFSPTTNSQMIRSIAEVIQHLIGDEELLRWPAVAAVLVLPWWLQRYDLLPFPLMVLAYLLAVVFAGGSIWSRYTLYLASVLCVSLAAVVVTLPIKPRTLTALVVVFALLIGGPVRSPLDLSLDRKDRTQLQIDLLTRLTEEHVPSEQLVYCDWGGMARIPDGAVSYYGSANRPYFRLEGPDDFSDLVRNGEIVGPLRGLCPTEQIQFVEPHVLGFREIERRSHYTYWTAEAVLPDVE
ncbi:glycosyltransferase family 39 protein [Tropicimonas sp. IMCC6043]|uniref:ArnT family glycosyltransferase n=1 Tax=Tropicimonas sp. IMCC6043 TaxID=2510645 RepID=UPI00101BAD10|nr:glycosyltransferase family 39 protein [Tropicimonas sp. IMCC6043]RYH05960.1 hypothetical protein EU800_25475 [Tropicimonas sp. IMCC6043]